MDIATIVGWLSGIVFIVVSILMAVGFDVGKMADSFVDLPSVMITIGGTFASTLIAHSLWNVLGAFRAVGKVVVPPKLNPKAAITRIIELSNLARKEGVLALEEAADEMEDGFLQKGIMLIVDGAEPDLVRDVLETEIAYEENRHDRIRGVWEFIGAAGPAWGMIGTLVGLIVMLSDMSDPDQLGPSLAVAIVTTFYGAILANFVAIPIATKMRAYSEEETLMRSVLIEGMLAIQAGENPRIIEERLKAFIAPGMRRGVGADALAAAARRRAVEVYEGDVDESE